MLCCMGSEPGEVGLPSDPQPSGGFGAEGAAVKRTTLSVGRLGQIVKS